MQTKLKEPKLCEDRGRFFVWLDGKRHYFTAKSKADAEVKRILSDNPYGICIIRDELAAFFGAMDA